MPSDRSSHQQIGQSVGASLRAARLAKKLTQSQLANPDFSVSYISAIERGQIHPSLRALEILARRLGLSSTELLPGYSQDGSKATSSTRTQVRSEQEIELELLEAQIAIRRGDVQQAIAQLLNVISRDLSQRQQVQLRYLLGWAYSQTAQLQEGESVLSEALRLIKDPDDYLSAQILNALGTVYASMHNYTQGHQAHQSSLELLQKHSPHDPFFLAQVYMNMGQHYTFLNKFEPAIEMFQRALAATQEVATLQDLESAYWNMFEHEAATQSYSVAMLYAYKYSQLQNQQASQLLRSEIYHYLGQALLKEDPEKAHEFLENALQEESVLADPLTLASVTKRMADWFLTHHRLAEADEYTERADSLTRQFGDTIIRAETLILCGRVAYARKQYNTGDIHFTNALKMLERLGKSEDLSAESARYAQLLEQRGAAEEALVYFKQAFDSRSKVARYPYD
jgi:tetratricopeptide (TPR) repeat protein